MALYDKALNARRTAGLDAYKPGEKVGKCTAPYVVAYDGGAIPQSRATGYRVIGVSAFVPLGQRPELDGLLRTAADALAGMGMRPRGSPGTEQVDDAFKAHVQTIEYTAPCAL